MEAELARLRALDRERQKAADQRMRGTVSVCYDCCFGSHRYLVGFLSRGNAA